MMQKAKNLLLGIILATLSVGTHFAEAKKCKKYKSLLIKKALTVCGNVKVCGTINGVNVGADSAFAYGSFINTTVNTTVVNDGEPVPFTLDTVPPFAMTHGAAPFTSITLQQTGIYLVYYKVRIMELAAVATQLYRNGSPVMGTDDSGFTTTVEGILFTGNAGDVITLVNISGIPFILGSPFGGTTPPASMVLICIA